LLIDGGTGSQIPVIVRASNIGKANQVVQLLFDSEEVSFLPRKDTSACIEGVQEEGTETLLLHLLGHQSGKELQLCRPAGFLGHHHFSQDKDDCANVCMMMPCPSYNRSVGTNG